jgi:hypothetical protein
MEEEMNYLSEKIEDLQLKVMEAQQALGKAVGSKGFKCTFEYLGVKQSYESCKLIINAYRKEISLLDYILSAVTNYELNK